MHWFLAVRNGNVIRLVTCQKKYFKIIPKTSQAFAMGTVARNKTIGGMVVMEKASADSSFTTAS